jgi:enoyl-CoA hydratase/carnithine racemase
MSEASPELLQVSEGGVARLTLNRPERRNALSSSLLRRLRDAFDDCAADASIRVVVIGAAGPVFSSGHDLNELADPGGADLGAHFAACAGVMQQIRGLPQPVIARVQGAAVAAGCQLVAACDLAVAAAGATFSTPGVRIGLFCTTPMVPLVRAIPPKPALEMLLTGAPISAERALELGLVNRVTPPGGLDDAVRQFAEAILAASPAVIRLGKAAFYRQRELDEAAAYERACAVMAFNARQPDAREGIAAFLGKRPPAWSQDHFEGLPADRPEDR